MVIVEYTVIKERSIGKLEAEVAKHLARGWELQGGYSHHITGTLSDWANHCQAMTLKGSSSVQR